MKRDSLFCLKQPHVYCSTTMLNTGVCFSVLEVYLSLVLVSGYKILLGKLRHQHTSFSLSVPCTAYYLALSGCLIVCIFPLIMSSALPCSVVSNSLRPHGLQTIRLLCPLNFPGKDTGWVTIPFSLGSWTFLVTQKVENLPAMRKTWV